MMPATGPVSLTRQTIYCIIPIMDIYAAYHIKKLRRYLLIMIAAGLVMGIAIEASMLLVMYGEEYNLQEWADGTDAMYDHWGEYSQTELLITAFQMVASYALAIYLIRMWSKQWNSRHGKQAPFSRTVDV